MSIVASRLGSWAHISVGPMFVLQKPLCYSPSKHVSVRQLTDFELLDKERDASADLRKQRPLHVYMALFSC